VWDSPGARQREYRQRQAALTRATGELLLAVLNAELEDPELQQQVNAATDDLTVLEALTAYYRRRSWQRRARTA
jgi:hypothetical protein